MSQYTGRLVAAFTLITIVFLTQNASACGPDVQVRSTFKIIKNEMMIYECQDKNLNSTGKSFALPFCILTVQDINHPGSPYKTGASGDACNAVQGSQLLATIDELCSDYISIRQCNAAGKPLHEPKTLNVASETVGVAWMLHKTPTLESSRIWKNVDLTNADLSVSLPSCAQPFDWGKHVYIDSSECVGTNLPGELEIERGYYRPVNAIDDRTRIEYSDAGPFCDRTCREAEQRRYWSERDKGLSHTPPPTYPPGTKLTMKFTCGKSGMISVIIKTKERFKVRPLGKIDDLKQPDLVRFVNSIRCR